MKSGSAEKSRKILGVRDTVPPAFFVVYDQAAWPCTIRRLVSDIVGLYATWNANE